MRSSTPQWVLGSARFDMARGVLHSPEGRETALRPKTLTRLLLRLREVGRVVSGAEILDVVWAGVFVTDDSITQWVVELRQAPGAEGARLRTVPKRGYLLELPAAAPAPGPAVSMGGVPVVAMLPLRLPQPDAALSLFAEGVLEGVLEGVVGVLARLREPVVISANSTRRFTEDAPDLAAVGARLGAHPVEAGPAHDHRVGRRVPRRVLDRLHDAGLHVGPRGDADAHRSERPAVGAGDREPAERHRADRGASQHGELRGPAGAGTSAMERCGAGGEHQDRVSVAACCTLPFHR